MVGQRLKAMMSFKNCFFMIFLMEVAAFQEVFHCKRSLFFTYLAASDQFLVSCVLPAVFGWR